MHAGNSELCNYCMINIKNKLLSLVILATPFSILWVGLWLRVSRVCGHEAKGKKNQSKDLAFVVLYNVTQLLDIPSCEI